MADSKTTQQVDVKKLLAEVEALIAKFPQKRAEREPREKVLTETDAIIADRRQKRAEREKVLAEMKAFIADCRQKRAEREAKREAREKALSEANSQLEREAKPFLTTAERLCVSFLVSSLAAKALF